MNKLVKTMCFIGGANIEILQKCPTEKNGFIATGVGILNVVVLSIVTMWLNAHAILNNVFLLGVTSFFFGFIIFIAYWGILSIIRKTIKYSTIVKFFTFISVLVLSFIATLSTLRYIFSSAITERIIPGNIFHFAVVFLVVLFVYYIPIVLKLLINSSTYEEEKERVEHNFLSQKEADIIAYRQKYNDYALHFNDANIKMESIKHLTGLSKEYHELLEKMQKETFDFLNKIEKSNAPQVELLQNCKKTVEDQFKSTLEKMSKIFNGI